jgi:protein-tyrosine phosphatase
MYTKIYWIHQFTAGARLGIMARPRGNDWLENEIINLKKQGVACLVSLLEQQEVTELGLRNEAVLCQQHSIAFINFPIADRAIPKDDKKVTALLHQLTNNINEGQSVVVHCRMGIGRSSIIAACLLLQEGCKTDELIQRISSVRGLKVPDTEEQVRWLKNRASRYRKP